MDNHCRARQWRGIWKPLICACSIDTALFDQPATGDLLQDDQVVSEGWVYVVMGNDGWDVISDYTTNLEPLMSGANRLAEKYSKLTLNH